MSESPQQLKSDLCAIIQKATCTKDLTAILNNIDFGDLQSLLQHYVTNQASAEKVSKLHRRSSPLVWCIGRDCLQHTLQFLDFPEMCLLSATNQMFRDLLAKEKDRIVNQQLLGHQAFFEFIFSEQNSRDLVTTKFALQKEYDLDDLNQYSFDEMGKRGILEGEDMALWQICGHFGWKKQMFAVFEDQDDCTSFNNCGQKPWSRPNEMNAYECFGSFDWKIVDVAGVDEFMWWKHDYDDPQLRPIVEVECPDKSWWNDFKAQNIKGNLYEQILKVHPIFKNIREWNKNSERLIGYVFHHCYDPAIWKRQMRMHDLGEKNILKGMDMIIWKLCKHFGFEMSLYLIDEDEFISPLPIEHILEVSGDGILTHDLSANWDHREGVLKSILGLKISRYFGCYRDEGSVVTDAQNYDLGGESEYVGMRIRCYPPRPRYI